MVSLVNIFNQILYYKNVENVFKSFQSKPFIRFCNISRFYGNNPTVSGCFLTKSAALTWPIVHLYGLVAGHRSLRKLDFLGTHKPTSETQWAFGSLFQHYRVAFCFG